MNKVTFPLEEGSTGEAVEELFEAIEFFLKNEILKLDEQFAIDFSEKFKSEKAGLVYADATAHVVYAFKEQHNLLRGDRRTNPLGIEANYTVDQLCAQKMNELLEEFGAFTPEPVTPESVTREASKVLLKPGMRNNSVKQLQDQLQKIGFTISDYTGYFGRSTRHAVVEFQLQNDMVVTGTVTLATLSAITKALMQREGEFKAKEPLSLSKEDLLYLEKNAGISPLDLKISDYETFSMLNSIAAAELGIFLAENFKDHPEKIREEIGKLNLSELIDMQMDIQSILLELADKLSAGEISAEEIAEFKAGIQKLEKADISQNPLATDLPLELHPIFKKFILIARFYQMCDSIGMTDEAAKEVIEWMRRYCSGLR